MAYKMQWNRFDICSAYYWFFTNYHEGQWSKEYKRLCKLTIYFKMGPLHNSIEDENMNTQDIYNSLVIRSGYEK